MGPPQANAVRSHAEGITHVSDGWLGLSWALTGKPRRGLAVWSELRASTAAGFPERVPQENKGKEHGFFVLKRCAVYLFFNFLAAPRGTWDLSSLTRD